MCIKLLTKSTTSSTKPLIFQMASSSTSSSGSIAPLSSVASMPPDDNYSYNNHQKDHDGQLLYSGDPHYALHGEIMLLVLVLLFIIFLFCILFFLYMKRRRGHPKHSSPEQFFPGNFPQPLSVHLHKANVDSTGSKLQQQYEAFRLANYHQPPV